MTIENQRLNAAATDSAPPPWARWQWLWAATFYLTLAAALTNAFPPVVGGDRAWLIALASAAAGWYAIGFRLGFGRGLNNQPQNCKSAIAASNGTI